MKPFLNTLVVLGVATAVYSETVHFTDGTRMEVASYEIRDDVVILLTSDGKLRSVPRSYVVVDALADEDAMVAEAIELLGLRRLTDEIAYSARQAAAGIDEGSLTTEMLVDAMSEGFASERIYRVAEETFRERASGMRLGSALEWLRSPFARRMERAEFNGSRGSLEGYIAELESAPPSGERVELLLRLDRASGTSDAAVEMQAAMMKALLQGMYLSEQRGRQDRRGRAPRTRSTKRSNGRGPSLHGRHVTESSCRCISCIAMCRMTSLGGILLTWSPKTASGLAVCF